MALNAPEALLYEKLEGKAVQCRLCARYCRIPEGGRGFCLVRCNDGGVLRSLSWGKAAGLQLDPIEKKPFFHFHPGARKILSFGTPGCNMRCRGCQNWDLSQLPRLQKNPFEAMPTLTPKQIVAEGTREKVDGFAYTYTEPTIFFEYARDTILEAREKMPGAFHAFVSNGYFSRECFKQILGERLLQAIRIDLKFIDDDKYLEYTSAHLEPVQESIIRVYNARPKIHLEVINLVVPGWNDDDDSLRRTAEWIAGVGKDIPTHFIRFFPAYEAQDIPATREETLLRAKKIAEDAGLEYAYAGNTLLPGVEDTKCPQCGKLLIKRAGMAVLENVWDHASAEEKKHPSCPACGKKINIVL
ncbi:MAG: AmmeMemoRadiSam system radical SAM enzyme [Candidatus Micrarchaeia archaeon]|jgi:pyruvate formate lyase activating enzyme